MEEKEIYEVISPSLNGYAYIHDFKTDNVLNTYDSCDLLNQQSKRIKELENENKQLKQQLAEKDKEIEYYKKQAKKLNNEAQKYFEDAYCNDSIYQDKISFCIEQLEKVKQTTECILDNALKNSSLNQSYYDRLLDEIGNQIKQLKVKAERS